MSKHTHLWNRQGYYYFRIVVPAKLINRFDCKELNCSLRTKDLHQAKYRCLKLQEVVQYVFMKIEADTKLEPKEVQQITKSYFKEALIRLEAQHDTSHEQAKTLDAVRRSIQNNVGTEQSLECLSPASISDRLDYLVPANYNHPKNDNGERTGSYFSPFFFDGNPDVVLKYVLEENNLEALKDYTPSYRSLKNGIVNAIDELKYRQQQLIDGESEFKIKHDWFRTDKNEHTSLNEDEKTLISEAFNDYISQLKITDERGLNKRIATLDLWLEINGDTPLGLIDKAKVRKFTEILQKLPSNRKKKYPDLSIEDILKRKIPTNELMKNKTINGHLSPLSSFIENHALKKYSLHYDTNPFTGMSLKEEIPEDELREPFSEEQLIGVFSSPIFQGCLGHTKIKRFQKGTKIVKDSMYWTLLIGLYSGARLNEILQLYVTDIYKVENIWVFDINKDGNDKRLKTKNSRRIIPIHKKVIQMGFVDYLEKIKKKKEKRVFPDAEISSDGTYSNRFSKKFSNFLTREELKTDITAFHSFRHNVADVLRHSEHVDEETSNAITGHVKEGTKGKYGSGKRTQAELSKHVPKLEKAMEHLQYPFLDDVLK